MNVDNGHLISPEMMKMLTERGNITDYEPVPDEYQAKAEKLLNGKDEAFVKPEMLRKWKEKSNKKNKRKIAKKSRSINRKK